MRAGKFCCKLFGARRRSLRSTPWNFEFFQAVRVLERLHPEREPVGNFSVPAAEAMRFRAHASTVFPASEIQSLHDADGERADMGVNFMGLFGPLGVLPLYYTELIAERARAAGSRPASIFSTSSTTG